MAFLSNPNIERPDHTNVQVGNQGEVVDQEPTTGKPIHRLGGPESQTDVDIGDENNPTNIGTDGETFESGTRSTGGAQELSGTVVSDQSNTFNIKVEWQDEDGNVLRTEAPSQLQGVADVDVFNILTKSDRFNLIIEDASNSATNEIHGTANAH